MPRSAADRGLTRRRALSLLSWIGAGAALGAACGPPEATGDAPSGPRLPELPDVDPYAPADNLKALMDLLLPAERDASGRLTSPGAVEAGALELLQLQRFIPLAQGQGLLPALPPALAETAAALDPALVAFLSAELDAVASEVQPFTSFKDLKPGEQRRAVLLAQDDPERRAVIRFVRAVSMLAYLGAVVNDVGLRAVGYPPFEDFVAGIAVSGYPRTPSGRLIDPAREDLAALAAAGELDDYTYNQAPAPTGGDDLSSVIDDAGDLY